MGLSMHIYEIEAKARGIIFRDRRAVFHGLEQNFSPLS